MRGILTAFLVSAIPLIGQTASPTFQSLGRQAEAARDAKQLDKSVDLYQRALKLKPDWDEGLWNLGSIAYDLDRYAVCAPAFRKLAKLKPDSAPAWTMSGLCEYKLHRYDAALESFNHVESLKFEEPPELEQAARLHLALVLTKSGSFERGITVLTDLSRIHKKTPEIVVIAGIAGLRQPWLPSEVPEERRDLVFKLGDAMTAAMELDYQNATQKFEAVLQQYPQEPNVHFRYGAYLTIQDSDRGIGEIKKALDLAPDHVPALVGLTAIYLKREEVDTALVYGERAAKSSPGDFSTHIALGRVLLAKDDLVRAKAELELAVKLAPGNPDAHFSLASAYAKLGRKDDSTRELAEFRRLQHLEK
ncbi:MAG TPA: tetratricopeptide repeat protein [Bryobacteraceae bacterium]|jgi:tetratricopeptide (TPR) repeat protein